MTFIYFSTSYSYVVLPCISYGSLKCRAQKSEASSNDQHVKPLRFDVTPRPIPLGKLLASLPKNELL